MERFISFLAPCSADRAGPLPGYLLLAALVLVASASGATVFTGVDTLVVNEGFDFSERRRTTYPSFIDFELDQLWELEVAVAGPGALRADKGIRDMGAVSFDSLMSVPDTLQPDSEQEVRHFLTGEVVYWWAPILQGHLYLVWTREGNLAKVRVEKIVSFTDIYEGLRADLWDDFIAFVVFRWAYQDDGSHSFETGTAVPATSWGHLKHLHEERSR